MSIDGVGAAKPFGEGLFLFEQVPAEETALCVGLYNDGTLLQGAIGQENVMVGAFHFLILLFRCGMPRCGWMGFGFSFTTLILRSRGWLSRICCGVSR